MINRRQFLYLAGAGALNLLNLNGMPFAKNGMASAENSDFIPDLELSLTARPSEAKIFPGRPTTVWQYRGEVIKGDPAGLVNADQS